MAKRIRAIKPEFFENEDIAALPRDVRMTLLGLWKHVDDYGRGTARASLIKANVWPLDDDITAETIDEWLLLLDESRLIEIYVVEKRTYLAIADWDYWQRVDRPTDSILPPPPKPALASPREPLVGEGREGERARGSARAAGASGESGASEGHSRVQFEDNVSDSERPPAFCKKHPEGTDTPCRACGNARLRLEAWQADRMSGLATTPAHAGYPLDPEEFGDTKHDDLPY